MNREVYRNISIVVAASLTLLAAVQCFFVWQLWRGGGFRTARVVGGLQKRL